ncbi:MAG TPA: dihydrofolate reductase family protein [Roseiflexaceae bacterium]|nr:dihydrofolate reductase family protein [Roseiflexaceae bacterium]
MRKVIVSTYITLDGVIENPMWTFPYWNDEIAQFQSADLFASDALLLGRETYEGFKEAWPARAGADAFADRINSLPKYVASRTLQTAEWNATVLQGDVPAAIAELKQQPGQNILKYGGGELLHTLLEHKLLDELHLLVYPVVVGSGARLVPQGSDLGLRLIDTKTFSTGVIALIYQPAAAAE